MRPSLTYGSQGAGNRDSFPLPDYGKAKPGCPNAASISPGNRMPFNSAEDAERAGYRAGGIVILGQASGPFELPRCHAPASLLPP